VDSSLDGKRQADVNFSIDSKSDSGRRHTEYQ
jgi:hypothetical protein